VLFSAQFDTVCNLLGRESSSQGAWRRCLQVISITFAWRVNRFNEKTTWAIVSLATELRTSREGLRKVRGGNGGSSEILFIDQLYRTQDRADSCTELQRPGATASGLTLRNDEINTRTPGGRPGVPALVIHVA
jgi:hypothetical protein